MNAETRAAHSSAAHDDAHTHGGQSHGSLRSYLTGFGLSVILTAIPFWLVMSDALGNKQVTAFLIMAFAAVQIVVHMIYFLHMDTRSEEGWSMMALIFTIIMVMIALTGSLWVMYHLNINMMPVHDMSQMP
ncbi:cytochrome o ubiquinol oxidase subunit IV [Pseudorhodoplanes sinuspersici]|uniref:Cytochrome bo(3) ubiquinol oxidase subunit 4 n=1 Tax=Pseudorhodoplanes sinuspersici TaxID=1235591 RepID=A0A1W6ZPG4_9HYPH|nr:cytochrome o ubiquinol oxidase subunit IV [Pseudorhodoplanes sinuspersici]ARP99259.1 cytochrome o ubiquinol oxidase subunit IV [Pseudorhodoplanes sinuspersici]RKE69063.1 cytochrome bo3 quinol oxidase subunit 4 [Pseudorhodoplanes sinuspersici]